MQKKVLGRGLSALIPEDWEKAESQETAQKNVENFPYLSTSASSQGMVNIALEHIKPNPYQPRKKFDEEMLSELADSIREHGIVEPIVVTKVDDHYQLVVGERRFLAAHRAGLNEVPAIVKNFVGAQLLEIALIENIQREDLNPLECAQAYHFLIKEHGITQEELAKKMGKSRPSIANTLRLLNLPYAVRKELLEGELSEGHARAVLMLEDASKIEDVWAGIKKKALSVRQTEILIRTLNEMSKKKGFESKRSSYPAGWDEVQEELTKIFSARVSLVAKSKNKGKISIQYSSREELERIVGLLLELKNGDADSLNVCLL